MIGANISMASDTPPDVGVRDYGTGPLVTIYFPASNSTAGMTITMPFNDARLLATHIENAIAAHQAMVARSQEHGDE